MKSMKVLILSAASGGGHLRAAHSIEKYINENTSGNEVKVIDALKRVNFIVDKTCCDGYIFLAKHMPKFFGLLYRKTNQKTPLFSLMERFTGTISKKLLPVIQEEKPDVIVSTHAFVTEMVSDLKGKGRLGIPLICLMTDYGPHRAWIAQHVDAYVVSNEGMIPSMVKMGAPKEKIFPFGIPVGEVFFNPADKAVLRRKFGLDEDIPTILIMAGSFGVTKIIKIYRGLLKLPNPFQMIVITGKNQKLYDAFQEEIEDSPKKTVLVYFTNEVENYMHAADLLVTKPGGLTVSEALACNIPLAIFDAIPGQEEDNADFLIANNMAVRLDSKAAADTIQELLNDGDMLDEMRGSCEEFDKSESNKNILELIESLHKDTQKS